jgi:hypothetical protein
MTLVETYDGEAEDEFRSALDELLTSVPVPPRRDWWHSYEIKGLYEWRGIRFRHFFCVAGSVEIWLWKLAVDGGKRRVIQLPSKSLVLFADPEMVGRGKAVPASASEVKLVE